MWTSLAIEFVRFQYLPRLRRRRSGKACGRALGRAAHGLDEEVLPAAARLIINDVFVC